MFPRSRRAMLSVKARVLLWIMQTSFYLWLAKHVVPYIRFNWYYTSLRGDKWAEGYDLLRPGDIILSGDKWKLTTIMIGGEWCHASVCIAKGLGVDYEVAEMTHTNYTKSWFFDVVKEATRVAIIRCKNWDYDYIHEVIIPECRKLEHAVYDYSFELNNFTYGIPVLYCSELVVVIDKESRLKVDHSQGVLGRDHVSATDLSLAEPIEWIYDTAGIMVKH